MLDPGASQTGRFPPPHAGLARVSLTSLDEVGLHTGSTPNPTPSHQSPVLQSQKPTTPGPQRLQTRKAPRARKYPRSPKPRVDPFGSCGWFFWGGGWRSRQGAAPFGYIRPALCPASLVLGWPYLAAAPAIINRVCPRRRRGGRARLGGGRRLSGGFRRCTRQRKQEHASLFPGG